MAKEISRRKLIGLGIGSLGGLMAPGVLKWKGTGGIPEALASACGLTPPQTSGPFYPGESQFTENNDLTQTPGKSGQAKGQIIYVRGQVMDEHCNPIPDATVEIWQACESGKYNHPNDPNPASLDPHFRYWGETVTDRRGEYIFKTIIPGAYPADTGWTRPPHIHFKIGRIGFHELITQMYFKGNPLNSSDLIFRKIPPSERERVVVAFESTPAGFDPKALMGSFDITLKSVR